MTDPLIPEFGELLTAFRYATDHADVNAKGRHTSFSMDWIEGLYEVHISHPEGFNSRDVLAYGTCRLSIVRPIPQHTRDGVFVPDRVRVTSSPDCWWVIEAWCDTTGWDCRSGGSIRVADSLEDLTRFGMSRETRLIFGLLLGDD